MRLTEVQKRSIRKAILVQRYGDNLNIKALQAAKKKALRNRERLKRYKDSKNETSTQNDDDHLVQGQDAEGDPQAVLSARP